VRLYKAASKAVATASIAQVCFSGGGTINDDKESCTT
jgi:hypothetical protein